MLRLPQKKQKKNFHKRTQKMASLREPAVAVCPQNTKLHVGITRIYFEPADAVCFSPASPTFQRVR
jgi:hypothetical protein